MKKIYTLALCFVAALSAKSQDLYVSEVFSDVTEVENTIYGTGILANGNEVDLFFDIFTPQGDNRTDRPLLIMAHQGSFIPEYGDKNDAYLVDYANKMAKRGFVVATINYREGWGFSPLNTAEQNAREIIPAAWRAIQDFKTAVRFFKRSADQGNPYGIDARKIFGGGFGAGGYLPLNSQFLDTPNEITLPELQRKNCFFGSCTPNGEPYVDTTEADLLGIFATNGGSPGYSFDIPLVINNSGAIISPKTIEVGTSPLVISTHATNDQATPYETDIVFAAGVFPIIEVSGSRVIHQTLRDLGQNQVWGDENRDGFNEVRIQGDTPSDNQYKQGLLTFVGEQYMWSVNDEDTYSPDYQEEYTAYMDSVVEFNAFRIDRYLSSTFVSINENEASIEDYSVFPNPAQDMITVKSFNRSADRIILRDVAGKIVLNESVGIATKSFDVSGLKPGVYISQINVGNQEFSQKLIKQ